MAEQTVPVPQAVARAVAAELGHLDAIASSIDRIAKRVADRDDREMLEFEASCIRMAAGGVLDALAPMPRLAPVLREVANVA